MPQLIHLAPELQNLDRSRPSFVPEAVWSAFSNREKAFFILWRRGADDATIQKTLFFNSLSGVRMMRRRVVNKVNSSCKQITILNQAQ